MLPKPDTHAIADEYPDYPSSGWRIAAIFCVVGYALLGWLRFFEALFYQRYLAELNLWPRPLYLILSGLGIGLAYSLALAFLLFRVPFTPLYMRVLGSLFLVWFWFDHTWLGTREAFYNQALVIILVTAITLVLSFYFVRKKDFQEGSNHDR